MADAAANRRGIALMSAAMALYVCNDACIKLTLQVFPPGQVLAVRGAVASVLVVMIGVRGTALAWRAMRQPIMAVRCALEISTALASVLALALAPLSTVSALMMTAPLMIAAASMALRWEVTRAPRLFAIIAGLCGTLLVLRPSSHAATSGAALALLCALSLACRDLVTRRMPAAITSATVAIATTIAVCATGLVIGLREHWAALWRAETVALAGAAACTALGNLALITALREVDLSVVTPFRYSSIVWAVALSALIWHETPDAATVVGIAVIVAAGLLSLRQGLSR